MTTNTNLPPCCQVTRRRLGMNYEECASNRVIEVYQWSLPPWHPHCFGLNTIVFLKKLRTHKRLGEIHTRAEGSVQSARSITN